MRILKKSLLSLSALLIYSNNVYATTTENVVIEGTMDFGKIILLLVAAGLVGFVLFLGYKMDKNDAQEKRKEEIIKKNKNDLNFEINNSHNQMKEYIKESNKVTEETAAFGNIYPNLSEEKLDNSEKVEDFDKTAVLERVNLSSMIENYLTNEEPEDDDYEIEEHESEEYDDDDDEYEDSYDLTMVFDTNSIQNEDYEDESLNAIKGYDYNEDDLIEIGEKIEDKKSVKRYTRKKTSNEVEEAVEEKTKRTRKTTTKKETKTKTTKKSSTKKDKEEGKEKTTRGRKTSTKKEVVSSEEKPKRTRKTTTKKAAEPKVKKTRAASTRKEAEKAAMQKKALNDTKKKTTKNADTKKKSTKKTAETKVKKTRAASVRKEIEKKQKK